MRLLKLVLTASGKQGVPQGGVISPLLSNIYLNEVDRMLERQKKPRARGNIPTSSMSVFADDLAVLIDAHPRNAWLLGAVNKRLREEFAKLQVKSMRRRAASWIWNARRVLASWGSISAAFAASRGGCGEGITRQN